MPVVKGGQNLPLLVGIGLTDLPNIGGAVPPLPPVPASLLYQYSTGGAPINEIEIFQKDLADSNKLQHQCHKKNMSDFH